MISSPAIHAPLRDKSLTPRLGGTLARVPPNAGHFLSPSRTSPGALCSVLLIRDARSSRVQGLHCVGANRAVCMRARRDVLPVSRRHLSIRFREAAHQLRTHNTNRHQSLRLVWRAAGIVLRTLPRPSIAPEVNDIIHKHSSIGSLTSTGETRRERLGCMKKGFAQWQTRQ
jgi:hypothetical protein